jgi:hypothetical protein
MRNFSSFAAAAKLDMSDARSSQGAAGVTCPHLHASRRRSCAVRIMSFKTELFG